MPLSTHNTDACIKAFLEQGSREAAAEARAAEALARASATPDQIGKRYCPRGHDTHATAPPSIGRVALLPGRTPDGHCRECRRLDARRRREDPAVRERQRQRIAMLREDPDYRRAEYERACARYRVVPGARLQRAMYMTAYDGRRRLAQHRAQAEMSY